MADKGFTIKDILKELDIELNIPQDVTFKCSEMLQEFMLKGQSVSMLFGYLFHCHVCLCLLFVLT